MTLIVCLDDQNGMAFNHRRQSKDRVVTQDILDLTADSQLYLYKYSKSLFEEEKKNIKISKDPFAEAKEADYILVEIQTVDLSDPDIEQLIVYRWNRSYPSDVKLVIGENWKLAESIDFAGYSHEKITKERYVRRS